MKVEKKVEELKPREVVYEEFDGITESNESFGQKYDEIYTVYLKLKDPVNALAVPYFQFNRKVNGVNHVDPRFIKSIAGDLVKLYLTTQTSLEYGDSDIMVFHLTQVIPATETKAEKLILKKLFMKMSTSPGKSLINRLINYPEEIKTLALSVFSEGGYNQISVKINGLGKLTAKYDKEARDKHTEVKVNKRGVTERDAYELEQLYLSDLRDHLSVICPNQENIKFVPETKPDKSDDLDSTDDSDVFGDDNFDLGEE